jgi:hypothetical protein
MSANGVGIPVTTHEVIIDTGTAFVFGDEQSILNVYATIPGSARLGNSYLWTSTLVTPLIIRVTNQFTCK